MHETSSKLVQKLLAASERKDSPLHRNSTSDVPHAFCKNVLNRTQLLELIDSHNLKPKERPRRRSNQPNMALKNLHLRERELKTGSGLVLETSKLQSQTTQKSRVRLKHKTMATEESDDEGYLKRSSLLKGILDQDSELSLFKSGFVDQMHPAQPVPPPDLNAMKVAFQTFQASETRVKNIFGIRKGTFQDVSAVHDS